MFGEVNVLQLGDIDWTTVYKFDEDQYVTFCDGAFDEVVKKQYDIVFIDREVSSEEIKFLYGATRAYTLYITDRIEIAGELAWLYDCKRGHILPTSQIQSFISNELKNYFTDQYGEKFRMRDVAIAQGFRGNVSWRGNCSVDIEGDFGDDFYQIIYWRKGFPIFKDQAIDFWLEYFTEGSVEIMLEIIQLSNRDVFKELNKWVYNEKDLENIVTVESPGEDCNTFVTIKAKGKGKLRIKGMHDRYSRRGHGYFMPGGERYVTSKREELFCYFNPGNLKPPLNIYFSGYKTREGFEGYNIMNYTGCPFLLISECRLEGGNFYMGDEEYEEMVVNVIKKYMNILGFTSKQVIMSGLSMGTYGALYYGCDIRPHAIILGKPVASIGEVAANEKRFRPGGFATGLDALRELCGTSDYQAIDKINARFWDKFDRSDWSGSKFIMAYMIEDDCDATAYTKILSRLNGEGIQVYGKGLHGRHNDNTPGIVKWFISQYENVLQNDFGRGKEE